jgi:hypothetical protein
VANYGKLSAYSCGGSCGIRALTRHRIPFSLLSFEETVISTTLKGSRLGLVNGDGFKPILLAAAKVQSIVPIVVGSRNNRRDAQDGNAVKSASFKAAAAPATVSGELPSSMPLEVFAPGRRKGR